MENSHLVNKINDLILNTKAKIQFKQFVLISLLVGVVCGFIMYVITYLAVAGVLAGIIATAIPYLRLRAIDKKRIKEIAINFPPMLKHLANYIRAGNNLRQAIEKTALVTEGKLGESIEEIVRRINGGEPINKAVESACEKIPLVEYKMFHIIISIHNDMGGNLPESLDNLAAVIEEKKSLRNEIDNITQETKVSAYITAVVPTVLYIVMRLASPDYMAQIDSLPFGKFGLAMSFAFIVLGVRVVYRMSDIKVDDAYR